MKFLKGICFLFLMAGLFVCGFWLGVEGHAFFYPGERAVVRQEKTVSVANAAEKITADTVYEVIEVDRSGGTTKSYRNPVPIKYIGMDREQFVEQMELYALAPPLAELENGFVSLEVGRFSGSRVTVYKYYETETEEENFYLRVENHYLVVYREDGRTRYELTDIYVPRLPEDLQQELVAGKVMQGKGTLYDFLESYSS